MSRLYPTVEEIKKQKLASAAKRWRDKQPLHIREKLLLKHRTYMKKYCKTDVFKKSKRRNFIKEKYGINESHYDFVFLIHKNTGCRICGSKEFLRFDHDHRTGEVRGILCNSCNIALGAFGDNLAGVRRVEDYLLGEI